MTSVTMEFKKELEGKSVNEAGKMCVRSDWGIGDPPWGRCKFQILQDEGWKAGEYGKDVNEWTDGLGGNSEDLTMEVD